MRQVLRLDSLRRLAENRWFAYGTILALQLKVMWQIWDYKDLPYGDTSYYFVWAQQWFKNGTLTFSLSPLYIAFYGTLLHLSQDVFVVVIIQRLLIALAVSVLMLGVMRRLLPAGPAWLIAAWWAILPINFDALVEVHLFGVLPGLAAAWVILLEPSARARGSALAILWAGTFLIRTEMIVAAGLMTVCCVGVEVWHWRRADQAERAPSRKVALGYAVPIALAVGVILVVNSLDHGSLETKATVVRDRSTLPVCQITTFNYVQQHPDQTSIDPWMGCETFMQENIGLARPTLIEALRRNPRFMLDNLILWNIRLIPDGLQVLMFNATSGTLNPDFPMQQTEAPYALALSLITCAVLIAGLAIGYRQRRTWWDAWFRARIWGWLLLAALALSTGVVMLAVRPRPEYMYSLSILIMAATGTGLMIIGRGLPTDRLGPALPAVMLALVIGLPSYYIQPNPPVRNLLVMYRRLLPFATYFSPQAVFVGGTAEHGQYSQEVCTYLSENVTPCKGLNTTFLFDEAQTKPLSRVFADHQVTLFYADEITNTDPAVKRFLGNSASLGWQTVTIHKGEDGDWFLLAKP